MLLRGMLSDEESGILDSSKIYRYGEEDAKRVHKGYEFGVIAKDFAKDYDAISSLVGDLNLNSTEGRRQTSLRISIEVNDLLDEISSNCKVSKIAAVRAILHLRRKQMGDDRTKIKLLTWNTDLYRSSGDSPNYAGIIQTVKNFLEDDNSLAILQEIPYYCKDDELGWVLHPLFRRLKADFPKEYYSFYYHVSAERQIMMTVMVCKKETFSFANHLSLENNRIVSCVYGDLTIIGVHMPTDFEIRRNDNHKALEEVKQFKKNVWESLLQCVREFNSEKRHLIIAGDFNAYIGCGEKETEKMFIELCRQAKDIVPDDSPTFIGNTPIDHVFINFDAKSQYCYVIEKGFSYSDHKRIEVALN